MDDQDLIARRNRTKEKIKERSKLIKTFKEEQKKKKRKEAIKMRYSPCYHPIYDKRFSNILKTYLTSFFIPDILACVPILIFEARDGFTTDEDVKIVQIETL